MSSDKEIDAVLTQALENARREARAGRFHTRTLIVTRGFYPGLEARLRRLGATNAELAMFRVDLRDGGAFVEVRVS